MTFIALFATWAFVEFKADAPGRHDKRLHPHDVELGNRLRSLLGLRLKQHLRGHSFGATFRYADLDPVGELANWRGPEREFVNGDLDNLSSEVIRLASEFDAMIAEYGNPIDHRIEFGSIVPDEERASDWHSKETAAKVQEVNSIATRLAEAGDNFEKAFRRLSPESYAPRHAPNDEPKY